MSRGTLVLACGLASVAVAALFATNVARHAFLTDDAFISFRYAAHLAEGMGLVWNPGERVEGYTNFLWVVLMAGAIRVGWAPETVSNVLGVASGAGVLVAVTLFSARTQGWRSPFVWVAPLALASSRTFTAWCTGGLATMFFTLLVLLGLWAFAEERRRAARPLGSSLLLTAATLTRPEGALFAAVAGLAFGLDVVRGRRSLRAAILWGAPYALVIGGHLLWRRAYYGFWLPNTFYAKVSGAWWEHGAGYLWTFHEDYRVLWFLPLLPLSLVRGPRFTAGLFATAIAAHVTYVAYIGGDFFEFRFLVVTLPLFYWLLADALHRLAVWPRAPRRRRAFCAAALAVAAALVGLTAWGSERPEARLPRRGMNSLENLRGFARVRIAEGRFLQRLIREGVLPEDLVLGVTGAGAVPYYTDWTTVDLLGLNDVRIAHGPVGARGVPGHERRASVAYLREREVAVLDVVNRIVFPGPSLQGRRPKRRYAQLPLRQVRAGGRTLIFATLLPDEELARIFAPLDVRPFEPDAPPPGRARADHSM